MSLREGLELDIKPVLMYHGAEEHNIPNSASWRTMPCPYHDDRKASARTNGFGFMCHGCGIKGNAITLLKEVDQLDYASAISKYEEISGRNMSDLRKKSSRKRSRPVFDESRDYERGSDLFSSGIRERKRPSF